MKSDLPWARKFVSQCKEAQETNFEFSFLDTSTDALDAKKRYTPTSIDFNRTLLTFGYLVARSVLVTSDIITVINIRCHVGRQVISVQPRWSWNQGGVRLIRVFTIYLLQLEIGKSSSEARKTGPQTQKCCAGDRMTPFSDFTTINQLCNKRLCGLKVVTLVAKQQLHQPHNFIGSVSSFGTENTGLVEVGPIHSLSCSLRRTRFERKQFAEGERRSR